MKRFLATLSLIILTTSVASAQFYIGPFVGFKASGLKGVLKQTSNGQVATGAVADGGSTGFNAGISVGYQVLPPDVLDGLYKLDINIEASYSSFSYLEEGFNSSQGAGRFAALGFDGGGTTVIAIDVLPLHRLNFSSFRLLSPFIGLGVGFNIMSTSDIDVGPPSPNGVITSQGDFKIGLIVTYGTIIRASSVIQPYFQIKHMIPFGSETEFTESFQSAGGGGSQSFILAIQDVPGYFNMVAGVRFLL
jgi:hypothetical protein